jgi:hypothetical protein
VSRFYQYDELARRQPVPLDDISRLAERISELAPFWDGVAVLSGSVAWGEPSWRSDIDVATFRTESFPDIEPMIHKVIKKYKKSMKGRFLIPKVDMIIVGAESQRLVTLTPTLTPSRYGPSSEMQTVRDVFAATGLRFFDHIGSLAAIKGEPWRKFHSTYLSQISRDRQTRVNDIRAYLTSFLDTWKQEPLRSLGLDPSRNANQRELDLMGAAESFPIHLMRRILAEYGSYPSPDRGCDIHSSFANLSTQWSKNLLEAIDPFLHIGEEYAEIVSSCRRKPSLMTAREYNSRLVKLFGGLPFARAILRSLTEVMWLR